jgi:hypothetical protein
MAWERQGRYYYRTRKVGGRVVREYVGTGRVAELVAEMDAIEREEREAERAARRAERAELEALDAPLNQLNDLADLLARAALVAAGFRQHKRGEWRKKRGNRKCAEEARSDRPGGTAEGIGTRPAR